jgi:hypothetical protein
VKLLVNTPTGAQELIAVGQGGGYFDSARVLWDERTDGDLPANITPGGMVRNGNALAFDQARMDQHTAAIAPEEAERVRRAAVAAAVSGDTQLVTLLKATPQQIDDHIEAVFPNLTIAQRTFFKRLIKLLVSQRGA